MENLFIKQNNLFDLSIWVKIFMIISFGPVIFLYSNRDVSIISLLYLSILLIKINKVRFAIKYSLIIFTAVLIEYILKAYMNTTLSATLNGLINIFYICFPPVIMATFVINSSKTSDIIGALDKHKVPRAITIPLTIVIRFIPTIFNEYKNIKDSMALRGINSNILSFVTSPIRSMEYLIVPLVIRSIKISEDLTISALTRGIENDKKRSTLRDHSISKYDFSFLLLYLLFLLIIIIIGKGYKL